MIVLARFWVVPLLILLLPATTSAELEPVLDVNRLVDAADVIVLGTFVKVTDFGYTSVKGYTGGSGARLIGGRILVRQVLKGYVTNNPVPFRAPVWATHLSSIGENVYGIVFLKRQGLGLEFVSPFYPVLHTAYGPLVYRLNPLNAVAETIAAVLRVPPSPRVTGTRQDPQYAVRRVVWSALLARSREVLRPIRRALDDEDREVRLRAVQVLADVGKGQAVSTKDIRDHEAAYLNDWKARLEALGVEP